MRSSTTRPTSVTSWSLPESAALATSLSHKSTSSRQKHTMCSSACLDEEDGETIFSERHPLWAWTHVFGDPVYDTHSTREKRCKLILMFEEQLQNQGQGLIVVLLLLCLRAREQLHADVRELHPLWFHLRANLLNHDRDGVAEPYRCRIVCAWRNKFIEFTHNWEEVKKFVVGFATMKRLSSALASSAEQLHRTTSPRTRWHQ